MNISETQGGAKLTVTDDPGKLEIYFGLAGLGLCLIFAFVFGFANLKGEYGPYEDPSEDIILLVGFLAGATFFVGWIIHALRGRKRKLRVYRVEGNEVLCSDGHGSLWREPLSDYRHISWSEEQRSYHTKYGKQYYTVQVIKLVHPKPERSVEIFAHQNSPELDVQSRLWSETLGVPIIRADAAAGSA